MHLPQWDKFCSAAQSWSSHLPFQTHSPFAADIRQPSHLPSILKLQASQSIPHIDMFMYLHPYVLFHEFTQMQRQGAFISPLLHLYYIYPFFPYSATTSKFRMLVRVATCSYMSIINKIPLVICITLRQEGFSFNQNVFILQVFILQVLWQHNQTTSPITPISRSISCGYTSPILPIRKVSAWDIFPGYRTKPLALTAS